MVAPTDEGAIVMVRYDAQNFERDVVNDPLRTRLVLGAFLKRPRPELRLFYVDHHDGWFDVYWVDAGLFAVGGHDPDPPPGEPEQ